MERNRSVGESVEDARLLRRVGAMFDLADPVPPRVRSGARAAFGWRDFDALLARLVDEEMSASVRGQGDVRLLTFQAAQLTVAVEATEVNGARKLIGQLVPAGAGEVALESADRAAGPLVSAVDHLGRFSLAAVPAGLVRLRCSLPDGTRVVTEWVET